MIHSYNGDQPNAPHATKTSTGCAPRRASTTPTTPNHLQKAAGLGACSSRAALTARRSACDAERLGGRPQVRRQAGPQGGDRTMISGHCSMALSRGSSATTTIPTSPPLTHGTPLGFTRPRSSHGKFVRVLAGGTTMNGSVWPTLLVAMAEADLRTHRA